MRPALMARLGPVCAAGTPDTGFDPLSINWAHAFWTDGPEFVALGLADGANVPTWPDEVGADDLAAVTNPTFVAADGLLNARPSVRLNPGNMRKAWGAGAMVSGWSVAVVCCRRAMLAATGGNIVGDNVNTAKFRVRGDGSAAPSKWQSNNPVAVNITSTVPVNTTPHLLTTHRVSDAGGVPDGLVIDGVYFATAYGAWGTTNTGLSVGSDYFDGNKLDANATFIGVKATALTAQEQTDLADWAHAYYGTPAPPP